jgi:hypothetical protein
MAVLSGGTGIVTWDLKLLLDKVFGNLIQRLRYWRFSIKKLESLILRLVIIQTVFDAIS